MSRLILVGVAGCGGRGGGVWCRSNIDPSPSPAERQPLRRARRATRTRTRRLIRACSPCPQSPGSLADFTAAERYLFDGIRVEQSSANRQAGATNSRATRSPGRVQLDRSRRCACRLLPLRERHGHAQAYLVPDERRGVVLDSGGCRDGEHEARTRRETGWCANRHGCFLDDEDRANYRATLPTYHVSIASSARGTTWHTSRSSPGVAIRTRPESDPVGRTELGSRTSLRPILAAPSSRVAPRSLRRRCSR